MAHHRMMRMIFFVLFASLSMLTWGQNESRYSRMDREQWKLDAERDYEAAFNQALRDLEGYLMQDASIIDPAYQLGYCAAMLRRPMESRYWYGMAYQGVKELGAPQDQNEKEFFSALLNNLGVVEMNLQEDASAITFFDEARALAEEMGDERGVRETLLNQAVLWRRMEQYEDAERAFKQVRRMYEAEADSMSLAFVAYNMGRLYERSGDWDQALVEFNQAEQALRQAEDLMHAANSCFEQVKVLNRAGRGQELAVVMDRFYALYAGQTHPAIQFAAALGEAARYVHAGDAARGEAALQRAAGIWSEYPDAFRGSEQIKVDLLYTESLLAALKQDYRGIERVIFSMDEETRRRMELVGRDLAQQRKQVGDWIEYMANLRGARDREADRQAIVIRNGLIFFVAALAIVLGILGYRQHRKGQRFLIGIISRRLRNNIDEAFDEAKSAAGEDGPIFTDLFEQIEGLMKKQQPYLDADLSVGGLAQMAKANYTYTSRAIQAGAGLGVADYINRYRVDHVMELMLNPKHSNLSLEHLSEMSGFNSVSTLYRQFKRFAGVTPGVFRKTLDEGGAN